MKTESRKVDRFTYMADFAFWLAIMALPILYYLFASIGGISPNLSLLEYIDTFAPWQYIKTIIDDCLTLVFNDTLPLTGYISYLVAVQVVHLFFDVVAFVPRLCHNLMDKIGG